MKEGKRNLSADERMAKLPPDLQDLFVVWTSLERFLVSVDRMARSCPPQENPSEFEREFFRLMQTQCSQEMASARKKLVKILTGKRQDIKEMMAEFAENDVNYWPHSVQAN